MNRIIAIAAVLASLTITGCGGSPEPGSNASNADLRNSIADIASARLSAVDDQVATDASLESPSAIDTGVSDNPSETTCDGIGARRTCQLVSRSFWGESLNPFFSTRTTYEVVFYEGLCWKATMRDQTVKVLSEADPDLEEPVIAMSRRYEEGEGAGPLSSLTGCVNEADAKGGANDQDVPPPSAKSSNRFSSASALTIAPGEGIGPLRLGQTFQAARSAAGEPSKRDKSLPMWRYDVIGGTLDLDFNAENRISSMSTNSRQATVNGFKLSDGFESLRGPLSKAGWEVKECDQPNAWEGALIYESPQSNSFTAISFSIDADVVSVDMRPGQLPYDPCAGE
jgi:hypothetical protein